MISYCGSCPHCKRILTRHDGETCKWVFLPDEDRWVSPEEQEERGIKVDPDAFID
jgi:hypothetical protein